MENFGFIITRHVRDENTNKYWNQNVKLIRSFYPRKKIVIIDDNSKKEFVSADHNYNNLIIIQSEYPQRGELLPFIYFLRNKWFNNAVIIHDGVFIHKRIEFSKLRFNVLPIWHFPDFDDNPPNTNRILTGLKNNAILKKTLNSNKDVNVLGLHKKKWQGVFGTQCFINHNFLVSIQQKYNIENLIKHVHSRPDRCSLERIFGLIFYTEYPQLILIKSLFGGVKNWGYTYDKYYKDFKNHRVKTAWVKVWTGR